MMRLFLCHAAGELQRHRNDEVRQGLIGVNTMEDYTVIKQLAKGGQGATMLVKHNDGSANMVLTAGSGRGGS